MLSVSASELNGTFIQGSSFYQTIPYTSVFPALNGGSCDLANCNVDNCILPDGYTISGTSTNKQFEIKKDRELWIVDSDLNPISPLYPDRFDAAGISKNPNDIPLEMRATPITEILP
jgi:hypothetical protein